MQNAEQYGMYDSIKMKNYTSVVLCTHVPPLTCEHRKKTGAAAVSGVEVGR